MTTKPLNQLDATEIVRGIAARHFTAEAVARACLERIALRDPQVQAWKYLDAEQVLERARSLDRLAGAGPLQGVPVGVKDLIDTRDMPTEYGSPIYEGHRPKSDAACVALSRRAGGIIMGKTVTTEFAMRLPGPTAHPMDPRRTPGGSSSGSAAAVGDFMVPLAFGTQTGGSTIRPASFCGCVGYRPTWGDLSCVGVKEAARSFDTLGLIARSVDDIALLRDVLLGATPEPLAAHATSPPRIGFCRTHLWDRCESSTRQLLEDCATKLARAGAQVEDVTLPAEFERAAEAHHWMTSFEYARNFSDEIENHWDRISEVLKQTRLIEGMACGFDKYLEARGIAERCRRLLDGTLARYDVLLAPAAAGEAPLGLDSTGDATFAQIWTVMLVPAISLPLFRGPLGLPVGAQLIAARNADRKLFHVARWVHRAHG